MGKKWQPGSEPTSPKKNQSVAQFTFLVLVFSLGLVATLSVLPRTPSKALLGSGRRRLLEENAPEISGAEENKVRAWRRA
jgi:hypothetical protein